ncbi:MAG: sensor histidine kinase [Jiangellales bacterium]
MEYFATTLAVVAGACLAMAMLFAFVGMRGARPRDISLLFAAFAFAYACAVLAARASYTADSADEALAAERFTAAFAAIGYALLLLFIGRYTGAAGRGSRWTVNLLAAFFTLVAALSLVAPELVLAGDSVVEVDFPWGETVLVPGGGEAPLGGVVLLAQLATLLVISLLTVREIRRGARERAAFLALGIGWFVVTVVVDLVVDAGLLDFVYLSDVGFLGFVVAVSAQRSKATLDTQRELLHHQRDLEGMVLDRTSALEEAQALLVTRAADEAALAERSRLARELHDTVTQLLFSVNLIAQSLPKIWDKDPEQAKRSSAELARLTRGALSEMRILLGELRPNTIMETPLETLVTQLTDGVAARQDLGSRVEIELAGPLPPEVHLAVYRIAQEAIANVARHAEASQLKVRLAGGPSSAAMLVEDDGHGFDPSADYGGSLGLQIMRERATEVGAELRVSSSAHVGTSVMVRWTASGVLADV